jgi:alanyl-tRNA synthetase
MDTTKLFWTDAHLTHFSARVIDVVVEGNRRWVELDQTGFYPEGGGQPSDTGRLNGVHVCQVVTNDQGTILHQIDGDWKNLVGDPVEGEIDWERRLEMMQQHTGQHILSQAFFQLYGAETRGFRIAATSTEIDLALELNPEETEQALVRAETLANRVVFDNREIRVHMATPEEALKLPLRKESFVSDCVRIIEIDGFDWSPCGGTHAKRTGEVGLIAVRGWERAKKMTRVQFVCGLRALADYRAAHRTATTIARKFTVGREEAAESVSRLMEENKRLQRRVRGLAELAATAEASSMIESATAIGDIRVVMRIFDDRDFEETKLIAHRLVESDDVITLLAAKDAGTARLVFARSATLNVDMNSLMKTACEKLGGRGGGKADFAQGGGRLDGLEAALAEAKAQIQG